MDAPKKTREDAKPEYSKPEIQDYGDLRELTANVTTSGFTDVPPGTPGPVVFSPTPP
jgi:hypothetical protein